MLASPRVCSNAIACSPVQLYPSRGEVVPFLLPASASFRRSRVLALHDRRQISRWTGGYGRMHLRRRRKGQLRRAKVSELNRCLLTLQLEYEGKLGELKPPFGVYPTKNKDVLSVFLSFVVSF